MYESKTKNADVDYLVRAILSLNDEEEVYRFLDDICTVKETFDLAQRLKVAVMLRNKATYNEISAETGMSTATISRVNRAMLYGSNGYKLILNKLEGPEE